MSSRRAAELDVVLIGGRERRAIVIADYDPAWPVRFAHERDRVRSALGPQAVRIEHIGSTSVPGLAAKPIVVAVPDPDDESGFVSPLAQAGYELRVREAGHRMLRTPARDVHLHVHVLAESDQEFERLLRFRDRLCASAEDRIAYERLKRELAGRD